MALMYASMIHYHCYISNNDNDDYGEFNRKYKNVIELILSIKDIDVNLQD